MHGIPDWLLDEGVHQLVEWVTGAIIAISTACFTAALVRRGAVSVSEARGDTRQSPEVLVVGALCAVSALGVLIWGLVDPTTTRVQDEAAAWVSLIGAFTLGFAVMAIYAQHRWWWDETSLNWRGVFRHTTIQWADLSRVAKSWDGQFVARDRPGHAIRWTTYTLRHEAISDAANAAMQNATSHLAQ